MALTEYDRGDMIYRGSVLADAIGGSISIMNGTIDVLTLRKGYAGFAKGSLTGTITCRLAVPKAGLEADFITVVLKQQAVKMMVVVAGKKIEVEGPLKGIDIKFAENSAAEGDFSVHGRVNVS